MCLVIENTLKYLWKENQYYCMVQKVVLNTTYSFFGISEEAIDWLIDNDYDLGTEVRNGKEMHDIDRDNPGLVAVVEALGGEKAGKPASVLKIVEVPDDVDWKVGTQATREIVKEKYRTWG